MTNKPIWNRFSSNKNDNDTKLITFRVPNSVIRDFDELVKFKRGTRTSYLVGFMDNFVREEFRRLEESNRINEFIHNIRSRNQDTSDLKKTSDKVWKNHRDDYEPPQIPFLNDDYDLDLRWGDL